MYNKKLINECDANGHHYKWVNLLLFSQLRDEVKNDIIDHMLWLPENIYKNATADNINGYCYNLDYEYIEFLRKAIKAFSDATGLYIEDAFYLFYDVMSPAANRDKFIKMIEVEFDNNKKLVYENGTVYRPSDLKIAKNEDIDLMGLTKLLLM